LPEEVAKFYPPITGISTPVRQLRVWLSIIAYNTNLVKAEDAPKSFGRPARSEMEGKIVKAHPGYSGTIMTATYQMQGSRLDVLEQLAKQNIMQCSRRPIRRRARPRRARRDGRRQRIQHLPDEGSGRPVEPVYARRDRRDHRANGIFRTRRIRTRQNCSSRSARSRGHQLIVDVGGLRSVHAQTTEAGRKPLKEIRR